MRSRFKRFKSSIISSIHQIPGWKTKRKIIVLESDDWGSIRMPSAKVYKDLVNQGYDLGGHYNRFDSIETTGDFIDLFGVLSSFTDYKGNSPIMTANFLVANPNFDKIKDYGYSRYFYETFIETYSNRKHCENNFSLLDEGIRKKLIKPQFHGREHLNVHSWLRALEGLQPEVLNAFNYGFWGYTPKLSDLPYNHFLSAYNIQNVHEVKDLCKVIIDGLNIFESIFGYRSKSFIATNYTWHPFIEKVLLNKGVKYIQGQRIQFVPNVNKPGVYRKRRYTGQRNRLGQVNLLRNVFFEPSEDPTIDWVRKCLAEITNAFYWHKPAIICSHRVNFMGYIDEKNRSNNLKKFKQLIEKILFNWPDVEFMTTDSLGKLIVEDYSLCELNNGIKKVHNFGI